MGEPRYRTHIPAGFAAGALRAEGEIENVARGGLFVGTGSLPDEGQIVELRFEAPSGGLVSLRGIVWWTTLNRMGLGESPGFGVRLIDANEAYEIFLGGLERGDPRA